MGLDSVGEGMEACVHDPCRPCFIGLLIWLVLLCTLYNKTVMVRIAFPWVLSHLSKFLKLKPVGQKYSWPGDPQIRGWHLM